MDHRTRTWDELAERHPGAYLGAQSMMFYGVMALLHDVASSLEWAAVPPWPPRVLAALVFGGLMLWLARRRRRSAGAAT
jgi:hypothetical protein